MNTENRSPCPAQKRRRGGGGHIPLGSLAAGDGAEETLARRARKQRAAQRMQFVEARRQCRILGQAFLVEAEARVEHDGRIADAGLASEVQRALKEGELVLDHIGELLAATAGVALHEAGAVRFAINLLPPSIVAERAEKAKIPFLAAGGAALVAALVFVMLGIDHETAVITGQRDAVQAKVDGLASFDKKVSEATKQLEAEKAEAEGLRTLMNSRSKAVQRLNDVRSSLAPGMWIEKWENGRILIRGWRDRVKGADGKTAGELVVDKLKGKSSVADGGVKISDMFAIGPKGQLEQFTLEVKFK